MAIRQEELLGTEAVIYPFPTGAIVARGARRAMMARRRRTLAVVTVGLAAALLMAGGSFPQGTARASHAGTERIVTVGQGDTLWGLAERFAPDAVDPRAYIDDLVALNQVEGPLQPGARLELP